MRSVIASLSLLVSGSIAISYANDARACGGCFTGQTESTQVTGHRMALSVSTVQTTLWDQISYDGDPAEFAWVLPIRGEVEIGLSSDLLFSALEAATQVSVQSPPINCASGCPNEGFGTTGATSGPGGGGVEVIAQEVVGPYETVQLQASDPLALANWLDSHGYNVPDDVQPIVNAYVTEGFGFLALRLVPGQGIDSMRPVRVTAPGAAPTLPLRMVAAGTGARTPITLWVLGEGRYNPQNFGFESISSADLVWNWDTQSSNYQDVRQEILDADGGSRWLVEAAEYMGPWFADNLVNTAEYDPLGSGYGDPMGEGAVEAAQADADTLLAGIGRESLFVTRISADLARTALTTDLALAASTSTNEVTRIFNVTNTIGTKPSCPPVQPCDEGDGDSGSIVVDLNGDGVYEVYNWDHDDGCGLARSQSRGGLAWLGAGVVALLLARRRRR